MPVSLAEIEVSGKFILGSVSPSRSEVPTQTSMGNPDGTRILSHLTNSTRTGNWVLQEVSDEPRRNKCAYVG